MRGLGIGGRRVRRVEVARMLLWGLRGVVEGLVEHLVRVAR